MSRPRSSTDFEHAIQAYVAGDSVETCARRFHTSDKHLADELKRRGLFRNRMQREAIKAVKTRATVIRQVGIDPEEIAARYAAGESENALANAYGISRSSIQIRLETAGVERRNQTEANRLLAENTPQGEHLRRIAIAQEATRGGTHSEEHRCKLAKTNERRRNKTSQAELLVIKWLTERGLTTIPQKAIGRYNVDIGAAPIAVEILGGSWHATKSIHPKRSRYILDRGWHLVFIWTHALRSPLQPAVADYIIALVNEFRSNPPSTGQYRVIRGDGKLLAIGSANEDNITPVVPGYESFGNRP